MLSTLECKQPCGKFIDQHVWASYMMERIISTPQTCRTGKFTSSMQWREKTRTHTESNRWDSETAKNNQDLSHHLTNESSKWWKLKAVLNVPLSFSSNSFWSSWLLTVMKFDPEVQGAPPQESWSKLSKTNHGNLLCIYFFFAQETLSILFNYTTCLSH